MGPRLVFRDIATRAFAERSPRETLCLAVSAAAEARGLPQAALGELRLFAGAPALGEQPELVRALADHPPDVIGSLYEALLEVERGRKRTGSFYTPRSITERVVATALGQVASTTPRVCDPALGGGAFLIEAARQLVARSGLSPRAVVERCLCGADINPLAVAVTEAVLWLWVGDASFSPRSLRDALVVTDALDRAWRPEGLDLVIGNPPWVAYAGRAAKPLEPCTRRRYAAEYRAFRGYPTLHGMFVERAAEIGPRAVVALLLPSPVADLDGYRAVRAALARTHTPVEPLLELGQDAFDGVTQPCFALVAVPRPDLREGGPTWCLSERQRAAARAAEVVPPASLARLDALPRFPRELFGEMGFQSAGEVSKRLFLRAAAPDDRHTVPLLEGREVKEFVVGPPRLFLEPDPVVLARSRARLRPAEHYERVRFVVRQTAKFPIASLHPGLPFRNTLLAGFAVSDLSPELVVALLNSSLYRALHLASRRDARQAAFPQVKVAHLRGLPRPPPSQADWSKLEGLTRRATEHGVDPALRSDLDATVYKLFGLSEGEGAEVSAFVATR